MKKEFNLPISVKDEQECAYAYHILRQNVNKLCYFFFLRETGSFDNKNEVSSYIRLLVSRLLSYKIPSFDLFDRSLIINRSSNYHLYAEKITDVPDDGYNSKWDKELISEFGKLFSLQKDNILKIFHYNDKIRNFLEKK